MWWKNNSRMYTVVWWRGFSWRLDFFWRTRWSSVTNTHTHTRSLTFLLFLCLCSDHHTIQSEHMLNCKRVAMKCPVIKSTMENTKEKSSAAAESNVLYLNDSPKKEPVLIKAQDPPAGVTTVLFPTNIDTSAVHDKENSAGREHDGTLDECFEDSGYLSLHNSQIDHHGDEDDRLPGMPNGKSASLNNSPLKCQGRTRLSFPGSVAVSTPVDRHRRSRAALSSTPTNQHFSLNLPILKFQRDVNEELAKSYKKNKW